MIAIDTKCVLCGNKIKHGEEKYSYDQYLHEMDKIGSFYCRQCREIVRCEKATHVHKKQIQKVPIKISDYFLPGFVLSRNGPYFIKKKSFFKVILRGKHK